MRQSFYAAIRVAEGLVYSNYKAFDGQAGVAKNCIFAKKNQKNIITYIEYPVHDLLLDAFNAYAFVGGMPEALAAYGETGSYSAVREIYDAIFMGYIEDVEKYSNLAKAKYLVALSIGDL